MKACRKALTEELLAVAKENPKVYVVTTDATGSVTLGEYAKTLPGQFIEGGIAEQNAVGVAGGLASCGKTVFVCAPSAFLSGRSYEQVKIDAVYNRRNVKLVGISAGVSYGTLGFSHHAMQDLAMLRTLPGLTVLVPCDEVQTKALVRIMAQETGPMYLRMGRNPVQDVYAPGQDFTIGKAQLLAQGTDLTILAMGEMVWPSLQAARLLSDQGISARVLDMFSLKPIDRQAIIDAAQQTHRLVTVEEHSILGGLGGAVCEITAETCPVPVKRIGGPDGYIVNGEDPEVFGYYHWTPEGIAASIHQWLENLR